MGLNDLARVDWRRITTNKDRGFGVDITFKTPDLFTELAVIGLATNHSLSIDNDGNPVQSKNVHVTISETLFSDASYPVRNSDNEVDLTGHLVSYADSTGVVKDYIVLQQFPDETVGVITCILGDFKQEGYDPLTDDELVMYYDFSGLVINTDNVFGTVDAGGLVGNFKNLKSNSDFDLTQDTTTAKFVLTADGIVADGINDFMGTINLPDELKNGDDFTFIVIGEGISDAGNRITFQGTSNNWIDHRINSLGQVVMQSRVSSPMDTNQLIETTSVGLGSVFISFMDFASNWNIISNGNNSLTGDLTNDIFPPLEVLYLGKIISGSDVFFPSIIKSILVYKNRQTDVQKLADTNTFLNNKWL